MWIPSKSRSARPIAAIVLAVFTIAALPLAAALPPLLDRELYFGDPEISASQLSPDGKFIAFVKPFNGTRNIWVKKTEDPFTAARPITNDTRRPVSQYFWTQDGRYILFVQDQGGDENYNVYAVDPAAKNAEGQPVPAARNLTEAKGIRAFIYSVPEVDPDVIYVGLNDRDKAWHDLYHVKISTGERKLLRENKDRITGWVFDHTGTLRLASRSAENGDTEVLRVEGDKLSKIYSCGVLDTCAPLSFTPDNKNAYFITNLGDRDLIELVVVDPATGKESLVASDPMKRVDLSQPVFSDKTEDVVGVVYEDDKMRIEWRDKEYEADYKWLQSKFPGRTISPFSTTSDDRLWLVNANSDAEPGEIHLFDRSKKTLALQYRVRERINRNHLASMTVIRYKSSDGLEIPAYLTLPKGVPAKNLPLIVVPHGGPWGRDTWGYKGLPQFLANRGYAVLQSNFRASTGYGKKFLNAGNMQWGEKMQDDLTWGVKHLVDQGIVDPKRVGIMGGSYGGYATLAGLVFTPDLYAAGVSIVGPSNLITLLESIPPYWESIAKMFAERMGDLKTEEGRARLKRQSPLTHAAKIKSPLLVIQGANDPRVKKAESDQIVVALRERGFPVEYIVAPDEGHGFARPVNNMAAYAATEKFLAKHLGGRFQEGATPEVAARLKEITVDVKTVELPKALSATSTVAAKPAADLTAGTTKYKMTISMGGQSMSMDAVNEIKEEDGNWVVTDTAKGPMGEIKDRTVLAKGTLQPISRTVNQGPATVELSYKDGKATGSMAMGGQSRPISADLGGPLFGEGAGSNAVLATLPLADGYTATYRNFDVLKQKVKVMQLTVAGSEKVTVPAGTFDAWKVELKSVDGEPGASTIWVDKATRKPVKGSAVLAEMGGASLVSEMVP